MASFDLGGTTGKVLIIVSDADHFELKKSDGSTTHEETGFFLQELTKPLQQLLDAGYTVTVSQNRFHGCQFVVRTYECEQ